MRLYHSPATPFGRKVLVFIHETGLLDRVQVELVTGTPLEPGSLPVTKNPLGKIPALEPTADGILEAALAMVYEGRIRPEDKQFAPWVEAQWAKAARALDAVERDWMTHLNGPLDAAQIAIGCALGYLDFRLSARNWREGRPNLAAWEAEFAKRPAMQATKPVQV